MPVIANNGTVSFNRSDDITYAGVISGTGGMVQAGGGRLTLTGNNSYAGGTTVEAGTLQIGDGGTTGTLGGGLVTLNAGTILSINRSDAVSISNVISGEGELVQDGPGTTTLGAIATYTGGTTVNNGTLVVGNSGAGGLGGIRGPVVVGAGASLEYGATRAFGYADDISVTSLVINEGQVGSDFYNYFWNRDESFPIEMTGGRLDLGGNASGAAGNHFLSPVITVNAASEPSVIGRADGNTTATLRLRNLTSLTVDAEAGATLVIDAPVVSSGAAGDASVDQIGELIKTGEGTLVLNEVNTFTGTTTVEGGTLVLGGMDAGGVGGIRGPVVAAPGAKIEYSTTRTFGFADGVSVTALTINEGQVGSDFYNYFWNRDESFPIEMTGGRLDLGGNASGAAGNHFLSPVITVNTAPEPSVIGRADGNTTATLRLRNLTSLTVDAEAGATLVIDAPIASSNANTDTAVNRTGGLNVVGQGTLVLNGASTYTGDTVVAAGVLVVNGSLGATETTVESGAALAGSGSLGGPVNVLGGGAVSPGNSIGSLAVGSLSMASGSTFSFEAQDASATGADLLVAGTLALTGVSLDLTGANLDSGTWNVGDRLTLISYTGDALTGGFAGFDDNTTYLFGTNEWLFRYADDTAGSNFSVQATGDQFVTMTMIPEPGAAVFALMAAGFSLLRRRRG